MGVYWARIVVTDRITEWLTESLTAVTLAAHAHWRGLHWGLATAVQLPQLGLLYANGRLYEDTRNHWKCMPWKVDHGPQTWILCSKICILVWLVAIQVWMWLLYWCSLVPRFTPQTKTAGDKASSGVHKILMYVRAWYMCSYCMARNIGGEFNLEEWRLCENATRLNSPKML